MLSLPDDWDHDPMANAMQHSYVQRMAELYGGPCDGQLQDIASVEELPTYLSAATDYFVHYYRLGRRGGRWAYEHYRVERLCGR